MRLRLLALTMSLSAAVPAMSRDALAQTATAPTAQPAVRLPGDANHANGFNYQPTPGQVAPREKAVGVAPPPAQEQAENRDLEKTDRQVLRQEGQSTSSVPPLTQGNH